MTDTNNSPARAIVDAAGHTTTQQWDEAFPVPAVPHGWRLVPVEPTDRMVIDGFESAPAKGFTPFDVWDEYEAMSGCEQAAHRARLCWAAMIASAPTPPAVPDAQRMCKGDIRLGTACGKCARCLAAPQPAAVLEGGRLPGMSTLREVEAMVDMLEAGEWAEHAGRTPLGARLEAAITRLHAPQPAAQPALIADLRLAAETLRRYQALHAAKGTDEGLEKARANAKLAARFEETLAGHAPALPLLAPDHQGMRVDYSGMLGQAQRALKIGMKDPGNAELIRQFVGHLAELGQRWYAGDTSAVDEVLQLYCIEDDARENLKAAQPQPSGNAANQPDARIDIGTAERIAFESTNDTGSQSLLRHWFRKGFNAALAAQPSGQAMQWVVEPDLTDVPDALLTPAGAAVKAQQAPTVTTPGDNAPPQSPGGAPHRIYLVVGDDAEGAAFGDLAEVTWSADRQGPHDVEYVLGGQAQQDARWYAVDRDGAATLCINAEDARSTAAGAAQIYPRSAPYIATQLMPVGQCTTYSAIQAQGDGNEQE